MMPGINLVQWGQQFCSWARAVKVRTTVNYMYDSPPVLQLIVKRRAGGHGTSLKKVTCARILSHLSLLH